MVPADSDATGGAGKGGARLVPYADVLATASAAGLACAYPNGMAFRPAGVSRDDLPRHVAGWVDAADATIRPALRDRVTAVPRGEMPRRLVAAWRALSPTGEAWLGPVHHWAAELLHGDGEWLEPVLAGLGIDPAPLRPRAQADAIAFSPDAAERLADVAGVLLEKLGKSDFALLLPPLSLAVTVHHHGQVWWQCADAAVADRVLAMGAL